MAAHSTPGPGRRDDAAAEEPVEFDFAGEVWHWRGPAPYHFITLPDEDARVVRSVAGAVTYGWGVIPVLVRVGDTSWPPSFTGVDDTPDVISG